MKCSRILILLVFALGPILAAQDRSYTFTPLAVPFPGATLTLPSGINNLGTIVGSYYGGGRFHGFVWQNGTYTTLDPPGSTFTEVYGINDQGDIVGEDFAPQHHGFILQGSVLSTIDFPGANTHASERPVGINNLDEIVGIYADNDSRFHGYLYKADQFISIDVPFPGVTTTVANGINSKGDIVGTYRDSSGGHGFLKKGSTFYSIDVPFPGVTGTAATGINNKGEIVGFYQYGSYSGYPHGFIFANGEFTRLDASFPGIQAVSTEVLGTNDLGEIFGLYGAGEGATQPFLAKPAGPEFVYVANANSGNVSGYTIDATTGALTAISGSPFAAGTNPQSVTVDPTGKFAYVTNDGSANVSGYTIDPTTGALTPISGSPFAAGTSPRSVAVTRPQ